MQKKVREVLSRGRQDYEYEDAKRWFRNTWLFLLANSLTMSHLYMGKLGVTFLVLAIVVLFFDYVIAQNAIDYRDMKKRGEKLDEDN